jgi:hypothetical protein
VDEYRVNCLWLLRDDYYPKTRDEACRILEQIERHGDVEAFRKASELRQYVSGASEFCIPVDIIVVMDRRRNGSTAALERLLDPVSRSLNIEAARKLAQLKADAKTQARVDELARKCNEDELTAAERSEYERYVTAGNLIAILQAKARLLLTKKA